MSTYYSKAYPTEAALFLKSNAKDLYPILYSRILSEVIDVGHLPTEIFIPMARNLCFEEDFKKLAFILDKNPHLLEDQITQDYVDSIFRLEIEKPKEKHIREDIYRRRSKLLSEEANQKLFADKIVGSTYVDRYSILIDQNPDSFLNFLRRKVGLTFYGYTFHDETNYSHPRNDPYGYNLPISPLGVEPNSVVVFYLSSVSDGHRRFVIALNPITGYLCLFSIDREVFLVCDTAFTWFDILNICKWRKKNSEAAKGLHVFNRLVGHKLSRGVITRLCDQGRFPEEEIPRSRVYPKYLRLSNLEEYGRELLEAEMNNA